jgi:hypothetical protein
MASCKQGNEYLGSIKGGEFFEKRSERQIVPEEEHGISRLFFLTQS